MLKYMNIKVSLDNFTRIREKGGYYVDKTETIREMLTEWDDNVLLTRPRRFGKTVWLTMCQEFLDVSRKGTTLFDGLKIMEDPDIVSAHMNQYPVIFLSLKDVYGDSLQEIKTSLRRRLSDAASVYKEDVINRCNWEYLKQQYLNVLYKKQSDDNLPDSLMDLVECLYELYERNVIILVDEYDVPLAKSFGKSYYQNVKDLVEKMLSSVCKTNKMVERVILTGCLNIAKASSYTGLNNIPVLSVSDYQGCTSIGFTEEEVTNILEDAGLSGKKEQVKKWYEGYSFGNAHIYNPWDVLNYVKSVLTAPPGITPEPKSYWSNSSETQVKLIFRLLEKNPGNIQILSMLVNENASLPLPIVDTLTYENITNSADHVWTALLETGYLTYSSEDPKKLCVPNLEVKQVIASDIMKAYTSQLPSGQINLFMEAFWKPDNAEAVQKTLGDILMNDMSVFSDQYEYAYQYFLLGLFSASGYEAKAEREAGLGRADIRAANPYLSRGAFIETKWTDTEEEFERMRKKGLKQIESRKYYASLQSEGYTDILCYSIVFYKKQCLVAYFPTPSGNDDTQPVELEEAQRKEEAIRFAKRLRKSEIVTLCREYCPEIKTPGKRQKLVLAEAISEASLTNDTLFAKLRNMAERAASSAES